MKSTIKLWIIDVDGTLTDGGIYYDEQGNEQKKFCTKDAAGFFVLHELGIKTMVLTGRECKATKRRAGELQVDYLEQGIKDKMSFLKEFLDANHMDFSQIAYVGDDYNDFAIMKKCGFKGCPADGCREIKEIADYVSPISGGHGAVRDVIEHYYSEKNQWKDALNKVFGGGI